ncbi:hypothetical protein JCM10295v2_002936 [Rhodotorula toruloides]
MSIEVYLKPFSLQPVSENWAKQAEAEPLKELWEVWDFVIGRDEGADIIPKRTCYSSIDLFFLDITPVHRALHLPMSAAIVYDTLVGAAFLQCATRDATNLPPMHPTLAWLRKLKHANFLSRFPPDSAIQGEPLAVWLERLGMLQSDLRRAAVEEERRLVGSILCSRCWDAQTPGVPLPRWHQKFSPRNKWKITSWHAYRTEKYRYERAVQAAAAADIAVSQAQKTDSAETSPDASSSTYTQDCCNRCIWQA